MRCINFGVFFWHPKIIARPTLLVELVTTHPNNHVYFSHTYSLYNTHHYTIYDAYYLLKSHFQTTQYFLADRSIADIARKSSQHHNNPSNTRPSLCYHDFTQHDHWEALTHINIVSIRHIGSANQNEEKKTCRPPCIPNHSPIIRALTPAYTITLDTCGPLWSM